MVGRTWVQETAVAWVPQLCFAPPPQRPADVSEVNVAITVEAAIAGQHPHGPATQENLRSGTSLWDEMPPIRREFGSPDFERLMDEDRRAGVSAFDPALKAP
jgi:hypothetical protein